MQWRESGRGAINSHGTGGPSIFIATVTGFIVVDTKQAKA